jgi:hypothetical protein
MANGHGAPKENPEVLGAAVALKACAVVTYPARVLNAIDAVPST